MVECAGLNVARREGVSHLDESDFFSSPRLPDINYIKVELSSFKVGERVVRQTGSCCQSTNIFKRKTVEEITDVTLTGWLGGGTEKFSLYQKVSTLLRKHS